MKVRCHLVALIFWSLLFFQAGFGQIRPDKSGSPNAPLSNDGDTAAKTAAIEKQLNQFERTAESTSHTLNVVLEVAALILVAVTLVTVASTFSAYNVKKSTEQQMKQHLTELSNTSKAAVETINSELRNSEALMKTLDEKHRLHHASLREFEEQLDQKHKSMLVNIPIEIEAVKTSLRGLLDDHKVPDISTVFALFRTLTEKQRQDILMEESKIATLLLLSTWRNSPRSGKEPTDDHAPRPENAKDWSRILRGLSAFYASKCYVDGWYKDNYDFEKACFYIRIALELDVDYLLARNDLGALLVSVKKEGGDQNEYYRSAEELLFETIQTPSWRLQRTYCNLAWAYSGQGKHQQAIDCLSSDGLLDLPFSDPAGKPYPQFVFVTRAWVLTKAGGHRTEALQDLEEACKQPLWDIRRIIKEGLLPGNDLEPLMEDEQVAARLKKLLEGLDRALSGPTPGEADSQGTPQP